jgi:Putative auto-transporter adhesin, head GIN domain
MKRIGFILGIILLLNSCKKNNVDITKYKQLDAFDTIYLNSNFDVFLTEGNAYTIEIEGKEAHVANVELEVKEHTLSIHDNSTAKWRTPQQNKITLRITTTSLAKLVVNATCNIKTENAITSNEFGLALKGKANEANLELNCNKYASWSDHLTGGKLTLRGKANKAIIHFTAIMSVDAQELTTKEASIENDSQGDCSITVTEKFDYTLSNAGNINLFGPDSLAISRNEVTSTGELIWHHQ